MILQSVLRLVLRLTGQQRIWLLFIVNMAGYVMCSAILLADRWFYLADQGATDMGTFWRLLTILGFLMCSGGVFLAFLSFLIVRSFGQEQKALVDGFEALAAYDLKDEKHVAANLPAFASVLQNLRNIVEGMRNTSQQVAATAEELTATAHGMEQNSGQQQNSLQEISAAVDLSARTVKDLTDKADGAARNASTVLHEAKSADEAMETLRTNAENIFQITQVIEGISEQINLLALNAAIEAARAGDAGRGFAVVAEEVRTLASSTNDSTQQIGQMLQSLKQNVQDTGSALGQITQAIESIVGEVNHISGGLKDQSDTAQHIAGTVAEFQSAMKGLNHSVSETFQAVQGLSEEAMRMDGVVGQFKI